VVPDLSFNLYQKPHSYDIPRGIVSAFSFRTDHGLPVALLAEYAEKIIAASPAESQHAVLSQVGRDSQGMRELHTHLCRRFGEWRVHYVEVESSLDTACQWYSKIERIYSNRLHALLLAASCGALPIAVLPSRRHVKVRALFDDLGLSSNVVDLENDSGNAPRELSWTMGNLEYQRLKSYFDRLLLDGHASASASNIPASQA
jgi:polysaccharide pyruvyl transferase WcaK-like protein